MGENYLMLNGKRIELTEEQVKTLTAEEKKSPFARVRKNGEYFYIASTGDIGHMWEDYFTIDDGHFSIANYCTNKAMMEQRALHETLNRLLWRYSEEHGGDNEWTSAITHFYICKNAETDTFCVDNNVFNKTDGCIYFKSRETAQSAIEEIVKPFMVEHTEFIW